MSQDQEVAEDTVVSTVSPDNPFYKNYTTGLNTVVTVTAPPPPPLPTLTGPREIAPFVVFEPTNTESPVIMDYNNAPVEVICSDPKEQTAPSSPENSSATTSTGPEQTSRTSTPPPVPTIPSIPNQPTLDVTSSFQNPESTSS